MAPKKGAQKMSLNDFLGNGTGSWADEMDSLPTAPAPKSDDGSGGDRDFSRRGGDFLSSRPDRASFAPRDDVPLPTHPPYTAFVGNLAFDLTESELGSFFGSVDEIKSAKIIQDHDKKPKGFGYVEFVTVEGLKAALDKNGASISNRPIRVNVAEPQKERSGGFGSGDDDKFSGNWRRDGPLPDLTPQGRDGGSRRRFEGVSEPPRDSASDNISDWRSSRPPSRFQPESEPVRRRGSGFSTPSHDGEASPADTEEKWTIGGRFKPSASTGGGTDSQSGSRFGSLRGRGDMGPPQTTVGEENNWRGGRPGRTSTSPTSSVPPTPQLARRKLDLLPRSTSGSSQPTPLSSPKSAGFTPSTTKSNPFGAAKPVDVTAREAAAAEKIEKERDEVKGRVTQHAMSRQSSRQARERPVRGVDSDIGARSPTTASGAVEEAAPGSPHGSQGSTSTGVRPAFSFANIASGRKDGEPEATHAEFEGETPADADAIAEKLAEVSI